MSPRPTPNEESLARAVASAIAPTAEPGGDDVETWRRSLYDTACSVALTDEGLTPAAVRGLTARLFDTLASLRSTVSRLERELEEARKEADDYERQTLSLCIALTQEGMDTTQRVTSRAVAMRDNHDPTFEAIMRSRRRVLSPSTESEASAGSEYPKHSCGLHGFNPMLGDTCSACDHERPREEANK